MAQITPHIIVAHTPKIKKNYLLHNGVTNEKTKIIFCDLYKNKILRAKLLLALDNIHITLQKMKTIDVLVEHLLKYFSASQIFC